MNALSLAELLLSPEENNEMQKSVQMLQAKDYYDRERVVGELGELTYELVSKIRSQEQSICFTWDGYIIAVYISNVGTTEYLWQVIESVQ